MLSLNERSKPVKDAMLKALRYNDLDFNLRYKHDTVDLVTGTVDDMLFIEQCCTLGRYMSEVQMPSLEVNFKDEVITFDWIPFGIDFFADYAEIQKHQAKTQQHQTKASSMLAGGNILDRATNDLNRHWKGEETIERRHRKDWIHNYGNGLDYPYVDAIQERVARSHAKAGKDFDIAAAKQLSG
jgi:hypothetical protein